MSSNASSSSNFHYYQPAENAGQFSAFRFINYEGNDGAITELRAEVPTVSHSYSTLRTRGNRKRRNPQSLEDSASIASTNAVARSTFSYLHSDGRFRDYPEDDDELPFPQVTGDNGDSLTIYDYRDLGDEGGFYERTSGPQNVAEKAVRTIYRIQELPEPIQDQHIEDSGSPTVDYSEAINANDTPSYVWTRGYTPKNVGDFLKMVVLDGMSIKVASAAAGIKKTAAYEMYKQYASNKSVLPGFRLKAEVRKPENNKKIQQCHADFIQKLLDENPLTTIKEVHNELQNEFPELEISQSGIQRFVAKTLKYSLKTVRTIPEARNSLRNKIKRSDFIKWNRENGIDYMKNCVFIDETGFRKKHVSRLGYSKRGVPCVVEVSNDPGINVSVIGAVSSEGIILLSRHAPYSEVLQHHERIGSKKRRTAKSHGTTATHFQDFIRDLLEVMGELNITDKVLILDNCSIHKGDGMVELIEASGNRVHFMPPYSPFLNPIEKVWGHLKGRVKRTPLRSDEDLIHRIEEAAAHITADHCRGYIRNSITFFDPCLRQEDIFYDEQYTQRNKP